MLSKKSVKILSIVLLVVVILATFSIPCFAANISESFKPDSNALDGTKAGSVANTVLGALKWIGVAIAIGMLIFLGIKYVTSSPEGKADLKKQLGVYIIGFTFIVGATVIVGILENMVNGLA